MKSTTKILMPLILIFFLFAEHLSASGFVIRESKIEHNNQERPCLVVTVEPEVSDLANEWSGYWRSEHRVRLRGRRGNLSAEKVQVSAFGERQFDLYTTMERESGQTRMYVYAAFGYDIYFGDEGQERSMEWLKGELSKFLKAYLADYYSKQIRDVERTVSRAERDMGRLTNTVERAEKTLKSNKDEIEKLQKENARLEKEVKEGREELKTQEQQLREENRRLEELTRKRDGVK